MMKQALLGGIFLAFSSQCRGHEEISLVCAGVLDGAFVSTEIVINRRGNFAIRNAAACELLVAAQAYGIQCDGFPVLTINRSTLEASEVYSAQQSGSLRKAEYDCKEISETQKI